VGLPQFFRRLDNPSPLSSPFEGEEVFWEPLALLKGPKIPFPTLALLGKGEGYLLAQLLSRFAIQFKPAPILMDHHAIVPPRRFQ
jgi:hypothetical protein